MDYRGDFSFKGWTGEGVYIDLDTDDNKQCLSWWWATEMIQSDSLGVI